MGIRESSVVRQEIRIRGAQESEREGYEREDRERRRDKQSERERGVSKRWWEREGIARASALGSKLPLNLVRSSRSLFYRFSSLYPRPRCDLGGFYPILDPPLCLCSGCDICLWCFSPGVDRPPESLVSSFMFIMLLSNAML